MQTSRSELTSREVLYLTPNPASENLRMLPDDEGRSDIRAAQLLMRHHQYQRAKEVLTQLLGHQGNTLRIRSLRATCAARGGDFALARKDIDFVKSFPAWQAVGSRLEANLLVEQKRPVEARTLLNHLSTKGAEDWLLYARTLEVEADLPQTTINDRQELTTRAAEIRIKYNFSLEYDFSE